MSKQIRACALFLALGALVSPILLSSCVGTGGTKIEFEAAAVGVHSTGQSPTSFENKKGWTIKLDKAHMLIGPVYLYEGTLSVRLWDYLQPIKSAYAHAGHVDASGQKTLGEILEHSVLDLLKGEATSLGIVKGVAGQLNKAELQLLPPGAARLVSGSASDVGGATVFASGTATKGSESRPFVLKLTVPDRGTMRVVPNIAANVSLLEDDVQSGKLMLKVQVDTWFTNVDFATLTEKNDKEQYLLTESNGAILQGVRSRYSYAFDWGGQ